MISIIISASRRTDIPAFYSEWFINRVREGFFIKVNPYNSQQQKRVSLLDRDVDCIVFWTKNPFPMMSQLDELDQNGLRYLFHFTLNHYPPEFEPRVPEFKKRIEIFKQLSEKIGSAKVIWRYDPVIISQSTPPEYHLEQFERVAASLKDFTQRVVISFLVLYPKVAAKFKRLGLDAMQIADIRTDEAGERLFTIAKGFGEITKQNNLRIFSCSEKIDLETYHIEHSSCIDAKLISRIFGLNLNPKKDQYQRPECQCAESVDMGFYDTCKFNCSYCYANTSCQAVLRNIKKHDLNNPTLIG